MLKSLHIGGFKSINSLDLPVGRINVLIGENGAGKSNILEAIGMLSNAASGRINRNTIAEKGIRVSTPSVYRTALKYRDRPNFFNLEAESEDLKYKCRIYSRDDLDSEAQALTFHSESLQNKSHRGKWVTFAGRSGRGIKINGTPVSKASLKTDRSIIDFLEIFGEEINNIELDLIGQLQSYAIYSPTTHILRGQDRDISSALPLGLHGGGLPQALMDIFNSATRRPDFLKFFGLIDWVKKVEVVENVDQALIDSHYGYEDMVLAFKDNYMPLNFNSLYSFDVSEGVLYICFMLALIIHPKSPKIFAVDNIDSTLNPGLVISLVKTMSVLAKKYNKQIFITSHNPTALDALDVFDEEEKLFVVERNKETGETEVNPIRPESGMTKSEWHNLYGETKLSELWLEGFIGGITYAD